MKFVQAASLVMLMAGTFAMHSMERAIEKGDLNSIREWLRLHVKPTHTNLEAAIDRIRATDSANEAIINANIVSLLLDYDVQPTREDLDKAFDKGNKSVVFNLIDKGRFRVQPTHDDLKRAIELKWSSVVNALLRLGVKPTREDLEKALEDDEQYYTVSELLGAGAQPDQSDLTKAIEKDYFQIVGVLLKHGMKPTQSDLKLAIEGTGKMRVSMVGLLLKEGGVRPTQSDLTMAIEKGLNPMVVPDIVYTLLFEYNMKPTHDDLARVIEKRDLEMLDLILPVSVELIDQNDLIALEKLGIKFEHERVKGLIEKGDYKLAYQLLQIGLWRERLREAIARGDYQQVVRVLSSRKPGIMMPTQADLKLAIEKGDSSIVGLLLKKGAVKPDQENLAKLEELK